MGLLEVVPGPPTHDINIISMPMNSESVNINTHLSTNSKHPLNSNSSGKGLPSSRRLRARLGGRQLGEPATAGAAGL
eukprot:12683965-Alexandrium_andersonii.AAC.1